MHKLHPGLPRRLNVPFSLPVTVLSDFEADELSYCVAESRRASNSLSHGVDEVLKCSMPHKPGSHDSGLGRQDS